MCAFIISLGLGDSFSLFGFRLIYVTTALALIFSIIDKKPSFKGLRNNYYRKMIIFGIIWVIYPVVTLFFVRDMSLWTLYYRGLVINFVVVWLIVRYIECEADWIHLARSCAALLCITLAVGMFETITKKHLIDTSKAVIYNDRHPITFYNNMNDSAAVMTILLFITLILFFIKNKKNRWATIGVILASVVTLVDVIFLDSRSVILGIIATVVVFIFYFFMWKFDTNKAKKIIIGILVMLILIALILFAFRSPYYYIGLITGEKNYLKSGNYESDVFRVNLIVNVFRDFVKTYGIGIGPGQSVVINDCPLHFFYLEILFDYGIVIGCYFLWELFAIGTYKSKLNNRLVDSFLNASFVLYLILGVATSKFFLTRMVWVSIALVFCLKYGEFDSADEVS